MRPHIHVTRIRDAALPGELSAQVEHAEWETRQRQDISRLEEGIIQAEDVFANPGPAVNSLGRARKTLLQASLEEKEHRDGGEPLPLHMPTQAITVSHPFHCFQVEGGK